MANDNETVEQVCEEFKTPKYTCKNCDFKICPSINMFSDRILAAHKREMADEKRISDAVIQSLRDKKLEMAGEIAAKEAEIAELRERIKIAEDALKIIDNMCDGDMCKFFDATHHCSACRYLNECQTGVAHAALAAIREKGEEDDK